jgi:Tfp pilus assembly PilM family ATPase
MPDKILGLDIGDSSLKAVQVTGGLRGYQVSACTRVEIGQDEGLEDALRRLFQEMAFDGGVCVASFQADRLSFRNLSMPFKDKKKIGQTIGYQLEPMLPFSVEALTTDYVVSEYSEANRILSASVQQEALEQYLDCLAVHHIDPDVVDISGVPTAIQLAKQDDGPSDALFIDMGSTASSAILFSGRTLVLVRSFHFGGYTITDHIAQLKELSRDEAERLKCGGDVDGFVGVVKPLVQAFCQEVQNTLHAFRCEVMAEAYPEKVFLSGGGALYPGMAAMLQECLEMPVAPVDLVEQTGLEMDENTSEGWNPLLMNSALALALRNTKGKDSFNFRVGKFRKQKRYDQLKEEIKRIGTYVAIILLVVIADVSADYYVLQKRHNHVQGQITSVFKKTFPEVKRIVDPAQQMRVKIREAKESMLFPAEAFAHGAVVDVLRDMILRIPKTADVDVSSLIIDEERVRLKGHTDSFNTVDAVKNGLQESAYFKDVAIASAQLDRSGNRVRFELIMGRK